MQQIGAGEPTAVAPQGRGTAPSGVNHPRGAAKPVARSGRRAVVPEPVSSPGRRTTRKESARSCTTTGPPLGALADTASSPPSLDSPSRLAIGLVPPTVGPGRARYRLRPGSGRQALPRGRAGLRALQRRQARARRAPPGPRLPVLGPEAPGPGAEVGPRPARRLRGGPVRRQRHLGRRPGLPLRRLQLVPVAADHDGGVQRLPGPALRRLRDGDPVPRHSSGRDPAPRRPGRRAREAPGVPRRRRSMRSTPRPQALLDRLEEEEREAILSRGSVRLPSDVPASAGPRSPSATPWPSSATPTSRVRSGRARSTAPVSP